jgi:catechol 2,3-dioxygenase-like lactoylglutathione lyase family enzyme
LRRGVKVSPSSAALVAAFPFLGAAAAASLLLSGRPLGPSTKEHFVLTHSKLQSIIWTSKIAAAETFYRDVLGLTLRTRFDGALVFDVGGGDLRISPVPSTAPTEHTVMGFAVGDVDSVIASLSSRGVFFERFPGFPHADNGTVMSPDGAKVAWFRDPDGNILSVVEFP